MLRMKSFWTSNHWQVFILFQQTVCRLTAKWLPQCPATAVRTFAMRRLTATPLSA